MKRLFLILALCLPAAAWADNESFSISADQWALPRSGTALLHLPPFSAAVRDWLAHPGARIVVVHAGSDQANLWAGELSDWLVALGVPVEDIDKRVSADQSEDGITLTVEH
jgi:hypothetical protein